MNDLLDALGAQRSSIFLPLVGRGGDDADPQGRGAAPQGRSPWSPRLAVFGVGVALLAQLRLRPRRQLQFVVNKPWIDVINSRYIVGLDGISLPLLLPDAVHRAAGASSTRWNHFPEPHNPKAFLILILILETGMVGTFVAEDLILFFVFFEVVLLPMYFMIGVWGGEQRQYAVDQVLPLHAVRLGADDRQLPGALLPAKDAPTACRSTRSTCDAASRRRSGIAPRHAAAGSSAACSWASASRCRCSRSTPGCPTPTPRRRPRAR